MRLSIGQVSRMFGFTSQALRFYEQKGVIIPSKDHNGRRFYDDNAVSRLVSCRKYRAMGYSLNEVVDQFTNCSIESVKEKLREKHQDHLMQMERCRVVTEAIKHYEMKISSIPDYLHRCTFCQSPNLLLFFNQYDDTMEEGLWEETMMWLEAMPVSRIAACYDKQSIQSAHPIHHMRKGFAIEKKFALLYDLDRGDNVIPFPSQPCAYTIIAVEGPRIAFLQDVDYVFQFLDENNLSLKGDPWGQVIFVECIKDTQRKIMKQYLELWFPI